MPVIHDVDAFVAGGITNHTSKLCIHGVLAFEFCCMRYVMECGVDKRSRALALLCLKDHPLFGLNASAAAEAFRRRGSERQPSFLLAIYAA
jgi:hypothetical protein